MTILEPVLIKLLGEEMANDSLRPHLLIDLIASEGGGFQAVYIGRPFS
jgi:hypothetical protein